MVRNKDLEQAILDLIRNILCLEYTGELRVYDIIECKCHDLCDPCETVVGHELRLGLPNKERYISWAKYGSEEDFLDFCWEEFIESHIEAIARYSINLTYEYKENRC